MEYRSDDGVPESQRPRSAPKSILKRLSLAFTRFLRSKAQEDVNQTDNKVPEQYGNTSNEEACAKLWSIYVSEAERYDAALVESWKADMEGMLIFSGLFSASLTAFLIESYKTLQPDSGDLTVAAIMQVSQQLAALADGSTFSLQTPLVFHATLGSLVCNALWFISLSLSLTCALLATLVEQWAREFLHKTNIRPSPGPRARIFSFLYFGLKNFHMHTIVDAIPFLLHASLLLFFVGLAIFLLPVNLIMVYLMCIVLGVFILLYTVLTILPIVYLDCPYRTPLSAPLWLLVQKIKSYIPQESIDVADKTMTQAILNCALQNTAARDQHVLQWTLESLTDDNELLPFVEAIPSVIYGPHGLNGANIHLFNQILGSRDVASPLVSRILNLLKSTQTMSDDDPLYVRRETAGWMSLCALSMMPSSDDKYFDLSDPDYLLGRTPKSTSAPFGMLGLIHHEHMWFHQLHSVLHDLLYQYHPRVNGAGDQIFKIKEVLHLIAVHRPSNYSGPHLWKISNMTQERLYPVIADCTSLSVSQLELAKKAIDDILDLPHWSANKVVMVAKFIQRCMMTLRDDITSLPLSVYLVCSHVLANFKPIPRDAQQTVLSMTLHLGLDSQLLQSPEPDHRHLPDQFAQFAFRLLPYISTRDQAWLFSRLVQRYNLGVLGEVFVSLQYLHSSDDIYDLAYILGNHLQQAQDIDPDGDDFSGLVHTIIIFIQLITYAEGSNTLTTDQVNNFITSIEAQIKFPLPPEITAAQSFYALFKLKDSLNSAQTQFPPPSQAQVEEICRHELLRPHCPLFLAHNVDISIVCHSLSTEITHVYLHSLADFLENSNSPVWASIQIFHSVLDPQWVDVDIETQTLFFKTLLEFGRKLNTLPAEFISMVMTGLWSWSAFGIWSKWDTVEAPLMPHIQGIASPCLQMLQETLKLYHDVEKTQGIVFNTKTSQQLAQAIDVVLQGRIEAQAVANEAFQLTDSA